PNMQGVHANFLISPGQNRSTDTGLYAQGEPDCSGGNSTGRINGNPDLTPTSCEDGSFYTLYSLDVTYESGPLYATVAYELHKDVNRIGDEIVPGTIGIRDESAYKLGVQYTFPTRTTLNVLVERLRSEEHTSELQSQSNLVCRLLLEKKKKH